MLVLREEDIISILHGLTREECKRLTQVLWNGMREYSSSVKSPEAKLIHQPIRESIVTNQNHTTLFMPASDTQTTTGVKIVTLPRNGGPPKGAINIFAPEGNLDGVLNAEEVTAFRTALASMIPFSLYKLPINAEILVFGAGKQAEWHIRLLLLLAEPSIARITFISRQQESIDKFYKDVVEGLREQYPRVAFHGHVYDDIVGIDVDKMRRNEVVRSDVICGCTPSTIPLFHNSHLGEGKKRFISLIGSYKPHMQEIDSATLLSATRILVDSKNACLAEAGELIQAGVKRDQLVEIGEIPAGATNDDLTSIVGPGNVIFKCVGMGIMDLVIGRELLNMALERGLGIEISEF
ncbi:hypothetical protein AJ80_04818 [Polytolypa hystricis UAMH7299]|uniref:Uncharacterized protein n=1 Tax=Polytolypa hystricis (strain UAMH7299) TaxID=1447883 RepID=A0A2B7Y957_POLH7|nr:hypothetical protein AJ80_04818 [Polytolypa hystricis UAMH7299]